MLGARVECQESGGGDRWSIDDDLSILSFLASRNSLPEALESIHVLPLEESSTALSFSSRHFDLQFFCMFQRPLSHVRGSEVAKGSDRVGMLPSCWHCSNLQHLDINLLYLLFNPQSPTSTSESRIGLPADNHCFRTPYASNGDHPVRFNMSDLARRWRLDTLPFQDDYIYTVLTFIETIQQCSHLHCASLLVSQHVEQKRLKLLALDPVCELLDSKQIRVIIFTKSRSMIKKSKKKFKTRVHY
jgi:hypothetical protein